MPDLEVQDRAGEQQRDRVRGGQRPIARQDAIGQPERDARDQHDEHLERDVVGRSRAPYPEHLRKVGAGRAQGGSITDQVQKLLPGSSDGKPRNSLVAEPVPMPARQAGG